MAYNRTDPTMFEKGSFTLLSPMACSGQTMWLFLMNCPQRHSSGVFRLGRGTIEDITHWDRKNIDSAFAEVAAQGMAEADWQANVVRFPKSTEYSKPENRNVAHGWAAHLGRLPVVPLVIAHAAVLQPLLQPFGIPLPQPLAQRLGELVPNSLTLTLTHTQPQVKDYAAIFEEAWALYKSETGRGTQKSETRALFDKLPEEDRRLFFERMTEWFKKRALIGSAGGFVATAPDPIRYVRHKRWKDELTVPKEKAPQQQRGNKAQTKTTTRDYSKIGETAKVGSE